MAQTAPVSGPSLRYQPALDGVRALTVLAIVAFHARGEWLPGGYVGVDVFFVLSGFLITTLLVGEADRSGGVSFGRFYLRRALRLFPALVVLCAVVLVGFAVVPGVGDRSETLLGTVTALTYTSSPVLAAGHPLGWMVHTWSLSVEEYFYLLWPVVLLLAVRSRRRLLVVGAVTVLAIGYRFWATVGTDWSPARLAYGADTRAEQLLIGCTAAVAAGIVGRHARAWHVVAVGAGLAAFLVLPDRWGGPLYHHGGSTLVAVGVAVAVVALVRLPASLPARVLTWAPLVWVGRRSYGIYLWNLPIVGLVAATPVPEPLQLPVKLVLTFVVPALSYAYVEQPFLRLKDRREPVTSGSRETSSVVV